MWSCRWGHLYVTLWYDISMITKRVAAKRHVYWAVYMMYLEWSEDTQIISPIMLLMMIKFDARIRHTRSCGRWSWWPMRGGYYTQTWVWEQTVCNDVCVTLGWARSLTVIFDDHDNDVSPNSDVPESRYEVAYGRHGNAQRGGVSYYSRHTTTANISTLRLSYGEYFILVL